MPNSILGFRLGGGMGEGVGGGMGGGVDGLAADPVGVLCADRACEPTGWLCRRGFRVLMLVATVVVLSLADLHMTLLHATTVGMAEDNPVARVMISQGDPLLLTVWKLGTVGLVGFIFVVARRRRSAEIGAWLCVGMLSFVMLRWIQYGEIAHELTPMMGSSFAADDSKWVVMALDGR